MPLNQEGIDSGKSTLERAAHGFAEAAREAWDTPMNTTYSLGMGMASGVGIKMIIDKSCAHLGGAGVVVKGALAVAPLAATLFKTAESKNGAEDLGRSAFDLALFWGAGKLGHLSSSGVSRIAAPKITEALAEKYNLALEKGHYDLGGSFNLPKDETDLAQLTKTGLAKRDGKPYSVYESPDLKTKVLLDEKMTRSFEGTEHPYRGVDLGMYPLRGLREFFALPNRDTVTELRFNAQRDGRMAAFVRAGETNIVVNGQRIPAQYLLRHEYVHTVSNVNPQLGKAYVVADALDAAKRISTYAGKNPEECLADTVGLGLIGQSGQDFVWTVHNNPLRSFVANRYLAKELATVAPESRSVYHEAFLKRSSHIDEVTPPLVTPILEEASAKPGLQRQAVRVLMNELNRHDPEAAALITTPALESNLAKGGIFGPTIDKLHRRTDLTVLSIGALSFMPGYRHFANGKLIQDLKNMQAQ